VPHLAEGRPIGPIVGQGVDTGALGLRIRGNETGRKRHTESRMESETFHSLVAAGRMAWVSAREPSSESGFFSELDEREGDSPKICWPTG
jgi:hypothetical protein